MRFQPFTATSSEHAPSGRELGAPIARRQVAPVQPITIVDPVVAAAGVTPPARRGGTGRQIGEVLVDLGYVERERVAAAAAMGRPEDVLLEAGVLTHDQLSRAVAARFGLDHLDLQQFPVDLQAARLVTPAAARRYAAVPVHFVGERAVLVAMADPANVLALDDIAVMTGYEARPAVASRPDLEQLLERLAGGAADGAPRPDAAPPPAPAPATPASAPAPTPMAPAQLHVVTGGADPDATVIGLVQRIISDAAERGSSDIHFEAQETRMRVRYRIDGVLIEAASIPSEMVPSVVSRIKIMGDLDIAERRMPQDGRVSLELGDKHLDIRVVTLPSAHGEGVVMRILDRSSVIVDLDRLGMLPAAHERFVSAIRQSHGAVLVTGPTGSGKSTTLYGALNLLNTPEKNIITIEDPVEYQLAGITQVQINPKAGLTFGTGLRSMMRADPDIIMVGEIRDHETAQIAIEAALTGHLVLSTLHTNDAPTAVTRLIEMGIEPFLVASAVDCVVAQRLARTLCAECKRRTVLPAAALRGAGFTHVEHDIEAYEPVGCPRCGGSGYKGRVGLYEVMPLTEEIRGLAVAREPADRIGRVALEQGMVRLRDDGLEKVRRGVTSIAEVARVAGSK